VLFRSLYFGGLFWFIHLEAHKTGLAGIPTEEKPSLKKVLLKGGHLISPLLVLIGFLIYGFSPVRAAFYAIVFTVVISWVRKETRIGPKEFLEALELGAKNSVLIIITTATVGFIIGGFLITGLGLNASSAIIQFSGGNFIAILFLVGLASIVLGMGMNTVAAFLLVSVVGTPALTSQGIDPFVANMFVFYFALLSHITPPVCLAIFAGAQIAGANIWKTAFVGMKMSAVPYTLPFLVIFAPTLLLIGDPGRIIVDTVAISVGFLFLISAIQGWAMAPLSLISRLVYAIISVCLIWPSLTVKGVGIALAAVVVVMEIFKSRRVTAA
jgi:TRAP transporter 4TM/12TM fusion protein